MIQKMLSTLRLGAKDLDAMEPISGMDATFLYGESTTTPMHVGSVSIIEGALEYDTFKKIVASRLHMMPILRKRLIDVPLGVDYPFWVDDPNFDINLHLHHVALPQPSDWKQLRSMASDIFSQQLDLSRPLWSFTFVEGLDELSQVPKGSVAIISKVHHVAVDGDAGNTLMSIIFDTSKTAQKIPDPKPYKPKPLPNDVQVAMKSALGFAKKPLKFPNLVKDVVTSTLKAGMITRTQHLDPPTAAFSAPRTPFNGIVSAQRMWDTSILSLDRIKVLKKIMGVTINDLILAICAGALRRYLDEKNELPAKPLVAMVPISTRDKTTKATQGNDVSVMLVQLATDIEDPIERLEAIYDNTIRGKTYQGALGAKSIASIGEVVPYGIANQAAKIYTRYNLARLHRPAFNLVITNVPGPQFPLYTHGHKVHTVMGTAPIIDGMGLMIAVLSYDGKVTITTTSDTNSMPDLSVFSTYIRDSANELEKLILKYDKASKKKSSTKTKKTSVKAESDKVFDTVKKYLKANPAFLRPDTGIYQFEVKVGSAVNYWQLLFNKPPGTVRRGKAKNPDATLTIKDEHLAKIGRGQLKLQTAFMQGRLSIDGDSTKAMKLAAVLMKIINASK